MHSYWLFSPSSIQYFTTNESRSYSKCDKMLAPHQSPWLLYVYSKGTLLCQGRSNYQLRHVNLKYCAAGCEGMVLGFICLKSGACRKLNVRRQFQKHYNELLKRGSRTYLEFSWRTFACLFLVQQLPPSPVGQGLLIHEVSRSHTTTHHSRQDSYGRVISSSQRPLPDNTHKTHNRKTAGGLIPSKMVSNALTLCITLKN